MPTDRISGTHRAILVIATAMTALLVATGGIVCVTESARGCPDWPRCYGKMLPPMRIDAVVEYTHRLTAVLTSPLIVAAAVLGWFRARSAGWVRWPPLAAVVLAAAVAVFGALAVLRGLPPWAAAIDLGSALLVLALLIAASVVACAAGDERPARVSFGGRGARLSLWAAGSLFVVLVSGVLVAESGSVVRCLGCIVDPRRFAAGDPRGVFQVAREIAAALVSALVVAAVVRGRRHEQTDCAIRRAASAAGLLLLVDVAVGALLVMSGGSSLLLITLIATTVGLWAALVALVVLNGLPSRSRLEVWTAPA